VLELLELLETAIIMLLAEMRETESLEKVLKSKFKHFNEDDVLLFL